MSGFEPTEAQTGVGYNMFTLIDPDAIPYPETDTWSLNYAAETIRSGGQEMASTTEDMETTWQGLQEHYTAPESETLFAAVEPVVTAGEDLQGDLATVATALEDLAEAAAQARRKLNTLRIEAQSFARDLQDRKVWWLDRNEEDDEWAIETNYNLKCEVNQAWSDFTTAETDCANAISGLHSDVVFTNPDDATGAANELVYGESQEIVDIDLDDPDALVPGLRAWALDDLTEWAGQEFHPADVEFENSGDQAVWDTVVVGLGFGIVQGALSKTGLWHAENGWASSKEHHRENIGMAWKEAGMEAASLVGIHNEDGWLIEPSSEDPYSNLSWDWWWGNAKESGREIREGFSAWSQRESDPEYHGAYTTANTLLLIPGAPVKVVKEILTFGGPGGGSGSGSGSGGGEGGDAPGTGANPFGGQGAGAPGTGGSDRDIGDIAEEGRTPITDRLDEALEQTPVLGPEGPGPGAPGGPSSPGAQPGQDPTHQDPADQGPAPSPTPPPTGTGSQDGETGGPSDSRGREGTSRGDGQQPRPRDDDQQGRQGTTPPPLTGEGSDTPGEGSGSGTQGREGRDGNEDTTRPRNEDESPHSPAGHRNEEQSPTPEAGGGGGHDGGQGPPPTSGGDDSGHNSSDDDGNGGEEPQDQGNDDFDPDTIVPSDHLPGGSLRANEGEDAGLGHTIKRHVNVDDDYLRTRTLGGGEKIPPSGRTATRYNDIEAAERATAAALIKSKTEINDWLSNSPEDNRLKIRKIDVEMDEIGVALKRQGSPKNPTGWEEINPSLVTIYLEKDEAMPSGFFVATSFPDL